MPKQRPVSRTNNVRALRKAAGLTLADLAARCVPTADVAGLQKIETGQSNLTLDWMRRIAAALRVPVAALIDDLPLPSNVTYVPVLGAVAAGQWQTAILVPAGQVPVIDPPRDAFALKADGDSMDKLIPDGGYVVVAPHERELVDGRIYVAMIDNDDRATVKRFRGGSAPAFEPCSTNDAHKPIALGVEPIRIIGRVVQAVAAL